MKTEDPIKKFHALNFHEMVDDVAGRALIKLIRGENWRDIIYQVAIEVAQWNTAQKGRKHP